MQVTAAQIRGARAMLNMGQEQLAEAAQITRKTLAGIEAGDGRAFKSSVAKVVEALEKAGIEFIGSDAGQGVLLKR